MPSIDPSEAPALFKAIETYEEPITRLGLKFFALTFVRTTELRLMRWDELKGGGKIWVIPAERMKLRKNHVVPLSTQAQAVLKEMENYTEQSELVFESSAIRGKPVSENTFLFALYRLGFRGKMTGHGFRALASSVLNENLGFDRDVIERQLAHKEGDAVRAAYNRAEYLPQRREMMQWWGDWVESQLKIGQG